MITLPLSHSVVTMSAASVSCTPARRCLISCFPSAYLQQHDAKRLSQPRSERGRLVDGEHAGVLVDGQHVSQQLLRRGLGGEDLVEEPGEREHILHHLRRLRERGAVRREQLHDSPLSLPPCRRPSRTSRSHQATRCEWPSRPPASAAPPRW